ncbi:UNVERIFIED_CONTAM: hypothetical protein GTU68_045078 [Idotea baltica]|nr:hypothetical protein [Idotea baltica]
MADQAKADDKIIQDFIKSNNLKAEKTSSGLYYIIEEAGAGANPNAGAHVTVKYTGRLLDGTVFDTSGDKTTSFHLNQVIKGWTEGLQLLKSGGKARLLIPSGMAYGQRAVGGKIKANAVLDFDVELLNFHSH